MFASTLGMSERTIMSWVQDYLNGSTSDEGKLSKSFEAVTEEAIQSKIKPIPQGTILCLKWTLIL